MLKPISIAFLLPLLALASPNRGADLLSKLPVRFEANTGQWPAGVRFATHAGERSMVLAGGGEARVGGLKLRPVNANQAARVEGVDKLRSGATYFLGQDRSAWRGNVPSFARVAYRGVYPGVDLVYKSAGRKVEYDFVLAPHADPATIRMEFSGAGSSLAIAADGALVASARGREELRQPTPFAYQEDAGRGVRTQVAARYRLLSHNQVAFTLGAYDTARPLVIDPVLIATYFGGDSIDVATAVAVDPQNQVWVAGYTSSSNLPLAGTPYDAEHVANVDIFVAKFNPNVEGADSLVWSTYLGGDNVDRPTAMALTRDGFLYLTGDTASTNLPLGGVPAQGTLNGATDAFLIRLSRSQQGTDALWYGTYLGGTGKDFGTAIALDAQDHPYIAGYSTDSAGFPFKGGSFQTSVRGGYDAFFAAIITDGADTLRYSTFLGGGSTDVATGIAVDSKGIVHLTGYTMSQDFPYTDGAYRTSYAGRGDIFYARADITRAGLDGYLYGTYIGGSDADLAYGMTQGADGMLYVTGYTFSDDFPIFGNPIRDVRAGASDLFLLRIDPSAPGDSPINYSTYLGGSGSELAYGISLSANKRLTITGYTDSTDFPIIGNPLQSTAGGGLDAFLAIVDFSPATPVLIYSSYVGGAAPDYGYQVAQDGRGNIYMVGGTTSTQLSTPNVFQPDLSRYTDAFLVRLNLCENTAACQAQGLLPQAAGAPKPAEDAAAALVDGCLAPGPRTLSLQGAVCTRSLGGAVVCTRKVCSADILK